LGTLSLDRLAYPIELRFRTFNLPSLFSTLTASPDNHSSPSDSLSAVPVTCLRACHFHAVVHLAICSYRLADCSAPGSNSSIYLKDTPALRALMK